MNLFSGKKEMQKAQKNNLTPFQSRTKDPKKVPDRSSDKNIEDGEFLNEDLSGVIEEGEIGGLTYKSLKRGNIHLIDKGRNVFKKDRAVFLKFLETINFDNIPEGKHCMVKGAGDTKSLVIYRENNEIKFKLDVVLPAIIVKLKEILVKN